MDIASAAIGMSQASIANTVQLSVMKMAMNNDADQGAQLSNMLDNMAIDTTKGNNIDVRA